MRILQISTYDISGGAARATYRLHRGLQEMGHDCRMLVRHKDTRDDFVFCVEPKAPDQKDDRGFFLDVVFQGQYINSHRTKISNTMFSLPYPGYDLAKLPMVREADIINLHWVTQFQSPLTLHRLFSLGKPVVWTLHDQWPFTGGCHYTAGCEEYRNDCDRCPQLADDPFNLPGAILKDKLRLFEKASLTIVTPSRWMAACARASRLFGALRVEVIPNSLEIDVFAPIPKGVAKEGLGLSTDTVTLLFGAEYGTEKRKGFRELCAAIESCMKNNDFQDLIRRDKIKLICFGNPGNGLSSIGMPVISLGYLKSDEKVRMAYSAADIFVQASLEDNLPNTMLEAMSCGTPVVAFDVGGMPDLIDNGVTGQLAPLGDTLQMGDAILSLLLDPARREFMGKECRRKMEKGYGLNVQARGCLELYGELVEGMKSHRKTRSAAPEKGSYQTDPGANRSDGLSVPLEPGVGVHLNAIYGEVLSKASREFASYAHSKWQAAESDRDARLEVIGEQGERIVELESEVDRWLGESRAQGERIVELESEVDRWLGESKRLQEEYREVEVERNELRYYTEHLRKQIEAAESDRAARLEVIRERGDRIQKLESEMDRWNGGRKRAQQEFRKIEGERNELRQDTEHLRKQIEVIESDRDARLEVIGEQGNRIAKLESEVDRWLGESRAQGERIVELESEVDRWLGESKRLQEEYREVEAERNELRFYTEHLRKQIEVIESDRAARLEVIGEQGNRIAKLESEVDRWLGESKRLQEERLRMEAERNERRPWSSRLSGSRAPGRSIKKKAGGQQEASKSKVPLKAIGNPLVSFKKEIDSFNNAQPNKELLDGIRAFNHSMIDQFNESFPLRGCMLLDIGASPHGYAMERALEHGVTFYAGIGLDVTKHEYVIGEENNTGILLHMNAVSLRFPDAFFDAVLSASVFEHIIDVPAALAEIDRVLKPGGCALISFEPVWSCSYGHHLHHFASCSDLIPPWSHLIWPREQMQAFLSDKWPGDAPLSLDQAMDWIYSGDSINRLNVRQFRELFADCPLNIVWTVDLREENGRFDPATIERSADMTGLDPDELTTKGLCLLLTKE